MDGAVATLADVLVAAMAVVGGWAVVRDGSRLGDRIPPEGWALLLALGFAAWAGASALWSAQPRYALLKGAGYAGLALAAAGVARSGLDWGRAIDAWLAGTGLAVAATVALAALGPPGVVERVTSGAAGGTQLPFPRLRGPFLYPAGFGDYLVLSAVLLWARWPAWIAAASEPGSGPSGRTSSGSRTGSSRSGGGRRERAVVAVAAVALASALAVVLALTVSTAWLAAGVLLLLWGRKRAPAGDDASPLAWIPSLALRGVGAAVAAVSMAALVYPLRIEWGAIRLVSSGMRPDIWTDAATVLRTAPLHGVGGAPFLARTPDPIDPTASGQLWDAHNAYLSLAGQYGLVGLALVAGAVWMLVRGVRRAGAAGADRLAVVDAEASGTPPASTLRRRARTAALAVLLAMGVHGVAVAGEDFRHWWAAAGVVALVAAAGRRS